MKDILLVSKPKGITSFDVIRELRKKLNIRKIGHAGTLDPMAEGLLMIGVGSGTKKINGLVGLNKEYIAEVLLGVGTDSLDAEGEVVERKVVLGIKEEDVVCAVNELVGSFEYEVPIYSAIKVEGKPLYYYARKGIKPPRIPKKKMEVFESEFLGLRKEGDVYIVRLRLVVSSGTYVRTLARVLGEKLGYPAHLVYLLRTKVGDFDIKNALCLDEVGSENLES